MTVATQIPPLHRASRSVAVTSPTEIDPLTAAQIEDFGNDGFVTVPQFLHPSDVIMLREIYDSLFERRAGESDGNYCETLEDATPGAGAEKPAQTRLQIRHCSKYAPELLKTQLYLAAEAAAKQLLGPKAVFWGDFAMLKPPGGGSPTPWHQDEAFWSPDYRYNHLGVWVPLQEATVDGGCMRMVPGSHKWGIVEHRKLTGSDCAGIEACDVRNYQQQSVPIPVPLGGASIHHCRTLHYAGPNISPIPRRAYILNFGTPTKYRRFIKRKFAWRM